MDLCHSKAGESLLLSRGAQHSSLKGARDHVLGSFEGLNRMLSVKQVLPTQVNDGEVECRNCDRFVPINTYRAHLDDEGDHRSLHVYATCDKESTTRGNLRAEIL